MSVSGKNRLNGILIVRDANVNAEGVSRLFENNGFPVTVTCDELMPGDVDRYGAIAHVAISEDLLDQRLGERLEKIQDEEWILIAGDDENDLHCTVELTVHASESLRLFIRSLWSMFSIS